jgi:WD40 repeat protein
VRDTQSGKELFPFQGYAGDVTGVAFSPDGLGLTAGATDGTQAIWDATPQPAKR